MASLKVQSHLPGPAALMVLPESGVPVPAGTVSIPDLEHYDILLGGGGSIEGTVTDPEGEPVAGAEVRAMVRAPRGGAQFAALGITDAEGNYRIDGLPAGSLSMFEVFAEGFARYPAPGEIRQQLYLSPENLVRVDVALIRGWGGGSSTSSSTSWCTRWLGWCGYYVSNTRGCWVCYIRWFYSIKSTND